MTLVWSREDETDPANIRKTACNCGPLFGNLDEVFPFLYIAQMGAPIKSLRQRRTDAVPGLFTIGQRTDSDRPGVSPHVGLVLPVELCADEYMRSTLKHVAELIRTPRRKSLSKQRGLVQQKLDAAFGGALQLQERERLDGFFALKAIPALFPKLNEHFSLVTKFIDDPADRAVISSHKPFPWETYGSLMEWYHGDGSAEPAGWWSTFTVFFVTGNMGSLASYVAQRWARAGLVRPRDEPSRWFALRPNLPDVQIAIHLEMLDAGWAKLHLTLDDASLEIWLSEVYDPLEEIVAWGQEVDIGDIPVQIAIDEEGSVVKLTVLATDDPQRVLFRAEQTWPEGEVLEGVVSRAALAAALKDELIRFFTSEFDPIEWDFLSRDDDVEEHYIPLRERVLRHPWLSSFL